MLPNVAKPAFGGGFGAWNKGSKSATQERSAGGADKPWVGNAELDGNDGETAGVDACDEPIGAAEPGNDMP